MCCDELYLRVMGLTEHKDQRPPEYRLSEELYQKHFGPDKEDNDASPQEQMGKSIPSSRSPE